MIFSEQSLYQIYFELKSKLSHLSSGETIEFEVIDPDLSNEFSGTMIFISGQKYIYRPFKVWVDLAEVLQCKIMTPVKTENNRIKIKLKPLDINKSWHKNSGLDITERYGADSEFSKIYKFEEPYFLSDYIRCLQLVKVEKDSHVLNLGINRGDEFKIFTDYFKEISHSIHFTGIDHCTSALKKAKNHFISDNYDFINEDFINIDKIKLEKQDLIISIGTLQSPEIDGKEIFKYLIQNIIAKYGSIILGFPNSRYIDCEVVYGAKTKNYTESNLNLLIKDISYYKKYLQQHGFDVLTFGKYYVFLIGLKKS